MNALELGLLLVGALLYVPMVWQDFRERSISLCFLFLPYANFIITFVLFHFYAFVVSLFVFAVAVALYAFNMLAIGDVIATPLLFADVFAMQYVIVALLGVALIHMGYGLAMKKEKEWWGKLPFVGYIGVANVVGIAIFLATTLV